MRFFLLAVLSHLIADFILQTGYIVNLKRKNRIKGYLTHGFILFTVYLILLSCYGAKTAFYFGLWVTLGHITIDWVKDRLVGMGSPVRDLVLFIGDQLAHLFILLFLWQEFLTQPIKPVFSPVIELKLESGQFSIPLFTEEVLVSAIFYLVATFVGGIVVKKILNLVKIAAQQANVKVGYYIGLVERALIVTLVVFGSISSLALVLTAKSLARFERLRSKDFAEYYLLGTLTSTFIALVGGLILKSYLGL
ncbi:DUF3307 domain-containing protein [Halothermothrix orenii]|uniref:DUF3307 domain-containing protein n=1 Tax=Halothermothrix orenii (strain H 168 / OCM 544 / DSM 9562) TaxID=373903 RepID=B8CYC8_HALOH|nr:DUF3307 domain-containing protein [Halothermothrix orenii]ACL70297.1 hypothetical protein Hore_15480 [Halothermothrix orenii H 168]